MFSKIVTRTKWYLLVFGLFSFVYSFILLLYFSFLKRSFISTSINICVADFIDCLSSGVFINFLIIPVSVVIIIIASEKDHTSINYYIRNKTRSRVATKQMLRILFFTIILLILLLIISIFIAGLMAPEMINWNSVFSYSNMSIRMLFDISFINVLTITFIKLLIPMLFFSLLFYTLNFLTSKSMSFFIIVLLSISNVFGYIKYLIDSVSGEKINNISYLSNSSKILLFGFFPLLIILTCMVAYKLVRRKDYLSHDF